jgi:deoxyhypusine monooxygenase
MEMEQRFDNRDEEYFKNLVDHKDYVIRTRAVCILADISGEKAIEPIGQVLLKDSDQLVRQTLEQALNDESEEVRESAMIALANLDYIAHVKRTNKFTSLTGG